jgi:hypothetical protein
MAKLKFKAVGKVRYPKGYWTKLIGGCYGKGILQVPLRDQRRRDTEARAARPPRQNGS